jgi:hypothetical protein
MPHEIALIEMDETLARDAATGRALFALVTDMQELEEAARRVQVQVRAIAELHGIRLLT